MSIDNLDYTPMESPMSYSDPALERAPGNSQELLNTAYRPNTPCKVSTLSFPSICPSCHFGFLFPGFFIFLKGTGILCPTRS